MMTKLKESVKELVKAELLMASKDYGDRFHSAHDAHLSDLENTAICAACECVQIAAMARKAQTEYGDSKHE